MARLPTIRKTLAALSMAVASLCGGGKSVAEEKGTLTLVELRATSPIRPEQRRRAADYLRAMLVSQGHDPVVRPTKAGPLAVWTRENASVTFGNTLPKPADFGIHAVARTAKEKDIKTGAVEAGFALLDDPNGLPLVIEKAPVVAAEGILSADAGFSSLNNEPVINFRFTEDASEVFAELTARSVGERFAIVVDGKLLSAPVVREPIYGGAGQISGHFSVEEAQAVALRMTPPPYGIDFVVVKTCTSSRPRAPPSWAPKWIAADPACD